MTSSASPCSSTITARRSAGKGACCAGQDIHDARRVAEQARDRRITCSTTRARFRQGGDGARSPTAYLRGETPVPCVACNQTDQVPRPARDGRRSWAPRRWPPAIMSRTRAGARRAASSTAPPIRSATRAISCSPPRASSSTSCAFRSAACRKDERASSRRDLGLAVAEKPDSQDICFVPTGPLHAGDRAPAPGRGGSRRYRPCRRPRARPAWRHHPLHHRPAAGARRRRRRAALCAEARCRDAARSWSARANACACARSQLRDVNWLGDEPFEALRASGEEVLARIRSSGPLQPARVSLDEDGETRRARLRRGRRLARTSLRLLCREWRRGAASGRRMDQVRGRRSRVGQERLCGIRGKKRNRGDVAGCIAVGAVQRGA